MRAQKEIRSVTGIVTDRKSNTVQGAVVQVEDTARLLVWRDRAMRVIREGELLFASTTSTISGGSRVSFTHRRWAANRRASQPRTCCLRGLDDSNLKVPPWISAIQRAIARPTYDALHVRLLRRLSHGVQVQGVYTWSKSLDTGSNSFQTAFSNPVSSLPLFDSTFASRPPISTCGKSSW